MLVSIHAPRVGCDHAPLSLDNLTKQFQFTHPVWGATPLRPPTPHTARGFNSRTPCGVRLPMLFSYRYELVVSIHAPRVGCDSKRKTIRKKHRRFNSRTPCGVRQTVSLPVFALITVSIHAPRVGCDEVTPIRYRVSICFNSRTPCGVRHGTHPDNVIKDLFQFTHPVWGATSYNITRRFCIMFQFTHPVWGATP